MAGKTLDLDALLTKDNLACEIARTWQNWDMARENWKREKVEIRKYIFATDTTTTSNMTLPWNNKTHIPKICQIRDNLFANYMQTMFPRRKWLVWEGSTARDSEKAAAIKDYMIWAISQKEFKDIIAQLVLDYIDMGNVIAGTEWVDETTIDEETGLEKPGFVGPRPVRYNPMDVVFNPIAPTTKESPKIIRSLCSMGEAKRVIDSLTAAPEDREVAEAVWEYMMNIRDTAYSHAGDFKEVDEYLQVDGFDNFRHYLGSNYVELLHFYGDFFDRDAKELYKNCYIVVVDRHKVILKKPHPTRAGRIPIYHSGWRVRQDNNWAMGPFDNLIGMQYRIDHVENLKADVFDLTAYPPLKIKGIVEDFEWGPFERIYTDQEGDVELMSPKADIVNANIEISGYEQRMEEMAGSPKEAMGFRTPGEKTKYEVQRLENAASRIFQNKITLFEEQVLEPLLNDMLALARDNLTSATIRVIDDEFKSVSFKELTKEDLSAQGVLKPVAARHFAEKADMIQNLNNFFLSPVAQDPEVKVHFSGVGIAKMIEELLEIQDYRIVQPYVRIAENQDAQRLSAAGEQQLMAEIDTPAGIAQGDVDDLDEFDPELDAPEEVGEVT